MLDELLYGKKLDQIPLEDPLLVISAGRSGSTQITRYLEDDPDLISSQSDHEHVPLPMAVEVSPCDYRLGADPRKGAGKNGSDDAPRTGGTP